MAIKAKDGTAVTDEMLEQRAREWEQDDWTGTLTSITPGRPRKYQEELETVSFRLPKSRIIAIEQLAQKHGESKSDCFRKAIDQYIMSA